MCSNFIHYTIPRHPLQSTGIINDGAAFDSDKVDSIIWSDEQVFQLIELRAKYANLFTGRKGSALIAYGKVAEELGLPGNFASVKKKWENLVDKYKKDRIIKMNMSGTAGEKTYTWKFYDAMDNFMKTFRSDSSSIRKPKLPPIILASAAELDAKSSTYYHDGQADLSSWMLPEEAEETVMESQVANHAEEEKECNEDNVSYLDNRPRNSTEEVVHPHKRHKFEKETNTKEGRSRTNGLDFALGIAMAKLKQISENVAQDTEKVTEFDLWAKSVATQLNAMEVTRALRLQLKLQTIVTEERLLHESSHQ